MLPNFQTPTVLLGLFLRKFEVTDFQTFKESLPWRIPEFDAEPQMAQIPPGANVPADMPRVRFASKDGRLMMEVAQAKIHFRMMPGEVTPGPQGGTNIQALPVAKAFENFLPQALRVYSLLNEQFGATAVRAGVVTDMIAPVPSSACQRMQKTLLGGRSLFGDRLSDLQIQALAKTSVAGDIQVNRRVAVRPLRTGAEGNPDLILNVNVDINTVPGEPYDLAAADLERFIVGVGEHLQTDIPLLAEQSLFD